MRTSLPLFAAVLALNLLGASWIAVDGDAVFEAMRVAQGVELVRPHHLLLTPLYSAVAAAIAWIAPNLPTFAALQCFTALMGATAAVLLFHLLRRARASVRLSLVVTLLWAASSAVWEHSRSPETGIVALPFVLGAFLVARKRPIPSALLLAIGTLLSMNVALLAPAWLYVARRRNAALVLLAAVAFPYAAAAPTHGFGEFAAWVIGTDNGPFSASALQAFARLPVGLGRVGFPQSEGETLLKLALKGEAVQPSAAAIASTLRNLSFAGALSTLALLGWARGRPTDRRRSALIVLPTLVFGAVWLGSDPQFWLPIVPFLWVLAARALPARSHPWLLALLALMLFTNRQSGAPTALDPGGDERWRASSALAAELGPAPLLVRPGAGRWRSEYVRVHTPSVEVLDLLAGPPPGLTGDALLKHVAARIDEAREDGRSVYVEGLDDVGAAGAWELLERYRGIDEASVSQLLR